MYQNGFSKSKRVTSGAKLILSCSAGIYGRFWPISIESMATQIATKLCSQLNPHKSFQANDNKRNQMNEQPMNNESKSKGNTKCTRSISFMLFAAVILIIGTIIFTKRLFQRNYDQAYEIDGLRAKVSDIENDIADLKAKLKD